MSGPLPVRDHPLGCNWRPADPDALSGLGLPPARTRAAALTRAQIIAEAYVVGRADPDAWVSYSRRRAFYARRLWYLALGLPSGLSGNLLSSLFSRTRTELGLRVPCHTTRHAGPHRAVRWVEVSTRASVSALQSVSCPHARQSLQLHRADWWCARGLSPTSVAFHHRGARA
jgi:hypothetical protein